MKNSQRPKPEEQLSLFSESERPHIPTLAYREMRLICSGQLTQEQVRRYREAWTVSAPFVQQLQELSAVDRLRRVQQLGDKKNTWSLPTRHRSTAVKLSGIPYVRHTRFDHSALCAWVSCVLGSCLGCSADEIRHLIASGQLHDIGHPALSHVTELFVQTQTGRNHEAESIARIGFDPSIQKCLSLHHVDPKQVVGIIEEKGYLGAIQGIADTLSYLILDREMVGDQLDPSILARVAASFVAGARSSEHITILDPEPFKDILEYRAELFERLYEHPLNELMAAAKVALLEDLFEHDAIEPSWLYVYDDHRLLEQVQQFVFLQLQSVKDAPWLRTLYRLGFQGEFDPERWHYQALLSSREAWKALEKEEKYPRALFVASGNFLGKKYVFLDSTGHEVVLKTKDVIRERKGTSELAQMEASVRAVPVYFFQKH